ncbi:MAG: ABC transporter permease [Bacillaceae bacterium]
MSLLEILAMIISSTLYTSAPLILAALGGVFSERSGIVNIGLEGFMIFGAFVGISFTLLTESSLGASAPWIAIIVAGILTGIFAFLHAIATIKFKADQVISGVAINFLALGIGVFAIRKLFGAGQTDFIQHRINKIDVPILSDIPVIGDLFFTSVPYTSYLAIILAFVIWFVIYKTPFGLRLRAVGEHPQAADTMGVNVAKMQYYGVLLSGVLAGIGGAVYATSIAGNFSAGTITGQGFLAIAAMIFGKWHPIGALCTALFFGFAESLSITSGMLPGLNTIPSIVFTIFPYILTIIALIGVGKNTNAPRALGVTYEKGKR